MSLNSNLGKLVSLLMIGLPACASQQASEVQEVNQANSQENSVISEEYGQQLIYDSEIEFTDSFPIPDGTHHVRVWKENGDKTNIIEINYEDGLNEKYWVSEGNPQWNSVEERVDRYIKFYSRKIPDELYKKCEVPVIDSDDNSPSNYWRNVLFEWQEKIKEFDAKLIYLNRKIHQ
ncbi:hypothetical protein HY837_05695 [archaeon]|nr:hypothetical protein [archaeon]